MRDSPGIPLGGPRHCSLPAAACVCVLCLGLAAEVSAQNCNLNSINLNSQSAINTFQANFGPCTRVNLDLNIEDFSDPGDEIVDLTPLSGLIEVGNILTIWGNPSLPSLAGLENLTTAETIHVVDNPLLQNLSGLAGLTTVSSLQIAYNTGLEDLSGLSTSLHALDQLGLTANAVSDLQGLPGTLTGVRQFGVREHLELLSLDGLPAFTGLEFVSIEDNEGLNDLTALAGSTMATANPGETGISVNFNFGLTSLLGLPAVVKLGRLEIEENPDLATLAGLGALQEIWHSMYIVGNPDLNDCSILGTVLDDIDDGDPGPGTGVDPNDPPDTPGRDFITLQDNLEGCNSIEEILGGSSEVIHADGFESG